MPFHPPVVPLGPAVAASPVAAAVPPFPADPAPGPDDPPSPPGPTASTGPPGRPHPPAAIAMGVLGILGVLSDPLLLGAALAAVLLVGLVVFTRRPHRRWFRAPWERLYSRLAKDDVLANDTRSQLLGIIEKEPGIHVSELVRRVDGGWGGLMHHLQVLEDKDFVTSRDDGRYRRLFPVGVFAPERMEKISKLRNESTAEALDVISRRPGINQTELAAEMGMASPSVRYHVERLQDAGLIRRERDGRSVRFYAQRMS